MESEVRGQKSEVRSQRSDVRGQKSEDGRQRSEVRGRKTEDGRQRTKDKRQQAVKNSAIRNSNPHHHAIY